MPIHHPKLLYLMDATDCLYLPPPDIALAPNHAQSDWTAAIQYEISRLSSPNVAYIVWFHRLIVWRLDGVWRIVFVRFPCTRFRIVPLPFVAIQCQQPLPNHTRLPEFPPIFQAAFRVQRGIFAPCSLILANVVLLWLIHWD